MKNQNNPKLNLLNLFLKNQIQVSPDALNKLLESDHPLSYSQTLIDNLKNENRTILLPDDIKANNLKKETSKKSSYRILKNYTQTYHITGIEDMSAYFLARLDYFKKQLRGRLSNTISISNLRKSGRDKISLIAIVSNKTKTRNGNYMFTLEDYSGQIKAIAVGEKVKQIAESVVYDDVLGFVGSAGDNVFFIDEIVWPDIPIKEEKKDPNNDTNVAFISDLHIGSKNFLSDKFQTFLNWLNGKVNKKTELYPQLSENIKYLFIAGDIVDGVGVYPTQYDDLEIPDIYKQYKEAANILSQIPEKIKVFISPGNHDYVRLAEPQPPISKEIASDLYELPNVSMVSNPCYLKIEKELNGGFNVLLYHGTSMDSLIPMIPSLKDGYKHPEKVMLAMLKRRHLSPPYETNLIPQPNNGDPLIIPSDVDIFQTGHVHSNGALNYRGVTLVNGGTWQAKTEFQVFLGHEPTPARVPVINLKNRNLTLIQF